MSDSSSGSTISAPFRTAIYAKWFKQATLRLYPYTPDPNKRHRSEASQTELDSLMASLGFAISLDNLWRFPSLVYENGGASFLIPYMVCSILFGLPVLFFEMCIGQTTHAGPAVVFGYMAPLFQGVGWTMCIVSIFVIIYSNILVSWAASYIIHIVRGESVTMSTCRNAWNTRLCESPLEDKWCSEESGGKLTYFFNGTCRTEEFRNYEKHLNHTTRMPAGEFFDYHILQRSDGIEYYRMNWELFIIFIVLCIAIAIALTRDLSFHINFATSIVPVGFIALISLRSLFLDGAYDGLRFFLLEPNIDLIWKLETWKAAMTQVCFGLSIGFGFFLSNASFNAHDNNCFRDAFLVVITDMIMNMMSGIAAFSALGYIAKQSGTEVDQTVQSGTSLIFVVYTEVLSRLPFAWFFLLSLYIMIFLIGIGSQFQSMELLQMAVMDQFPKLSHKRWRMNLILLFLTIIAIGGGTIMCTTAGVYWFNIFNEFTGSSAVCLTIIMELFVVCYVYGINHFNIDIRLMLGRPLKWLDPWIGPSGILINFNWMIFSPLVGIALLTFELTRTIDLSYGRGTWVYQYPTWAYEVGWTVTAFPTLTIPIFAILNCGRSIAKGNCLDVFQIQKELRSYDRIINRSKEPERVRKRLETSA